MFILWLWCLFSWITMAILIYRIAGNNKRDELTIGPWQLFEHHTSSFFQYLLIVGLLLGAPILLPAIIILFIFLVME